MHQSSFALSCAPVARRPIRTLVESAECTPLPKALPETRRALRSSFRGAAVGESSASGLAQPRVRREALPSCSAVSTPPEQATAARPSTSTKRTVPDSNTGTLFRMKHTFEHTATVKASADDVRAVLAAPATLGMGPYAYQPHVVASVPVSGARNHFEVEEKASGVTAALLPNVRSVLTARVEPACGASYEIEAWSGNVRVTATLHWIEDTDRETIRLVETGAVEGPAALAGAMARSVSTAHRDMTRRVAEAAAYRRLLCHDGNGVGLKELVRIVGARTV